MISVLIAAIIGTCFLGMDFSDAYTLLAIAYELRKFASKYKKDKNTGKKHSRKTEYYSE